MTKTPESITPPNSVVALLAVLWLPAILGGCGGPGVPNPADPVGRVYLFRGQGWVFSGGWRTLCERLRAAGAQAEDLSDHGGDWAVGQIVADRKTGRLRGPLVLVGHSRGGRVCLRAAEELAAAGVAVDLILTVDVMAPPDVPANVRRAVNLYLTEARVYPAAPLQRAPGSAAAIENIDLNAPGAPVSGAGLDHLSVTGSPELQEYLFRRIARVMRGRAGGNRDPYGYFPRELPAGSVSSNGRCSRGACVLAGRGWPGSTVRSR